MVNQARLKSYVRSHGPEGWEGRNKREIRIESKNSVLFSFLFIMDVEHKLFLLTSQQPFIFCCAFCWFLWWGFFPCMRKKYPQFFLSLQMIFKFWLFFWLCYAKGEQTSQSSHCPCYVPEPYLRNSNGELPNRTLVHENTAGRPSWECACCCCRNRGIVSAEWFDIILIILINKFFGAVSSWNT